VWAILKRAFMNTFSPTNLHVIRILKLTAMHNLVSHVYFRASRESKCGSAYVLIPTALTLCECHINLSRYRSHLRQQRLKGLSPSIHLRSSPLPRHIRPASFVLYIQTHRTNRRINETCASSRSLSPLRRPDFRERCGTMRSLLARSDLISSSLCPQAVS
jgi:hypothetical protein